jgi:hypothetical protein
VWAFARAFADPERRAEFENLPMSELFKLAMAGAGLLPRLQEAERIARGCKVVRPKGNDGPEGGAEWRIIIYEPPPKESAPDPPDITPEADQWEEAS